MAIIAKANAKGDLSREQWEAKAYVMKEIRGIGRFAKGDLPNYREVLPKGDLPRTISRFCQRRIALRTTEQSLSEKCPVPVLGRKEVMQTICG